MLQLIVGSNQEFAALELADCPDTDVLDVVYVLDSQRELTPQERCEVNNLAFGWDLPPINDNNRRWLAEKILQHAVIERRRAQMKQLRKGLKESGVLTMIKERPALAEVLFPKSAEQVMDSQ
ncbi:hypothetical protein ATANTOWER_030268, partial [Ataeniobius toweri]|nr:hypothetical protein [Ataeniobius toweri]